MVVEAAERGRAPPAPEAGREVLLVARKEQRRAGGLRLRQCCAARPSLAAELPAWLAGKLARGQAVAHIL